MNKGGCRKPSAALPLSLQCALPLMPDAPQLLTKEGPVERRPGVALAQGRHSSVAGDAALVQRRPGGEQLGGDLGQGAVLGQGIGRHLVTLELDADGEVVEGPALPLAVVPAGAAGVPGAAIEGHELDALAVAADQQVGGDPQMGDGGEEGVGAGVQPIGEEDRKSTRLNSSHVRISYAVFCLKK